MDLQYLIVFAIIAAAIFYAGLQVRRRSRSFSLKKNCGADCGCGKASND